MDDPGAASPDPLARRGAIAIAAGRIGVGVGALAFTRPALTALGFEDPQGGTVALARMAGVRDIALGLHALAVRDDATGLALASKLGAAADAGDAFAFGAALVHRDGIGRTAAMNLPIASAAAIAGAWVSSRLRPRRS